MAARRPTLNKNQPQSADDATALPVGGPNRGQIIAIYLFLALISLAVFSQTIRYNFVNFDDDLYVYDARAIKAGLTIKGIAAAFTTPHARNWHPFTTISHMLDCQLYGLKAGGHHATNMLLHMFAVLLLFRVLQQMTSSIWKSSLVAALFAVHPLHVESVAWVSERKDVLSAVFFFLMLSAYARYARAPSTGRYLLVATLFAAGLMSKAMLVTAPVILLLLDYWPLQRTARRKSKFRTRTQVLSGQSSAVSRLILEKLPLLALSAGACVVTFVVQKRAVGAIPPLPLSWRAENAVVSYLIYVWQTLWPTHLAAFYPHPNDTLALWEVILATGLLVAITVTAIVFRSKRPYLFTGWLWYLLMLVPVIGLVQVGEQGHADRYTYLPHVGLFLLMVWGVADVIQSHRFMWRVAAVIASVVIFALAATAYIQTSYWRNSEALWTHALAVTYDNDFAHNNLGYLCIDSGELDKAISHFEAAAMIRHGKTNKHYNVGSAFVEMNLADALARKGLSDEAMIHYQEAIRLEPNYADAYYNRGNVLFAKGNIEDAIADWEKTLQLQPNDADAHTCLGNALLRKGSLNEAIAHYETALALAPEDPRSRNNLAWILATSSDAKLRDGAKAVEFAQQAVAISGGREPQFVRTLAAAYAESGRFSESIAAAQQAAMIANMQGKPRLANNLEKDLLLYRAYLPLRANSLGD
jgi:tetratricopeptide (TPR) repeat protein